MGNITVKFIGKEYSIPEDVLTYIDLLEFTDNVQKQLASTFVRKLRNEIAKDNMGLLGDDALAAEFEQQIGKFIAKLCDNGIFTRTINDYLKNNKGYQLYSDVNKAALNKMKSLLIQEMDAWQAGYENAVNKAESHVTGMGFSIWSSSFVNHAIYAAMEASTLNKQGKEAEAQYQKDINDLSSRLDSQYGGEKSNYINNTYIPNMEAALTVFAYELLDKYVADLIATGKFDGKTLDYVDIGRSNDLLKNLTLSNNKQAILENAFAACPYNIAVYMQAMKYDLLDYDSFQAAKVFKQDHHVLSFFRESWGEVTFPTKFNINYHCINVWAALTGKTNNELLRDLTEQYATGIVKAYSRVADMMADKATCRKIIGELREDVILSGDLICIGKAREYVESIVHTATWEQLTERCGHTELLSRIKKCFSLSEEIQTKKDLDGYITEQLATKFEEARKSVVAQIEERRQQEETQRRLDDKARADAAEFRKKRIKRSVIIVCSVIVITFVTLVTISLVSFYVQTQQEERAYQDEITKIENQINNCEYEDAVKILTFSSLSIEDKTKYYNLLVEGLDLTSVTVNGLELKVPDHWTIDYSDDGHIVQIYNSKDSTTRRLEWYIKYRDEADYIHSQGKAFWKKDSEYSQTSVRGCDSAYIRNASYRNPAGELYHVIDIIVECNGAVFNMEYFAYEERFFEDEFWMLLNNVSFGIFRTIGIDEDTIAHIYYASDFLGREFDSDESIIVSEEENLFLNTSVELFGITGQFELGASSSAEENSVVNIVDWISDIPVDDLGVVIDCMEELYGSDYDVRPYSDCPDDAYIWKNVDEYQHVLCWVNSDGTVTIRWMI